MTGDEGRVAGGVPGGEALEGEPVRMAMVFQPAGDPAMEAVFHKIRGKQ